MARALTRLSAAVAAAGLVAACSSNPVNRVRATTAPTPTASPSPAAPAPCRVGAPLGPGAVVSVIGDSYTSGGGRNRWPDLLAARTGWTVHVDAADGSSYTIGGFTGKDFSGPTFGDQVRKLAPQRPDLVIIMGSRNDITHTDDPYPTVVRDTLRAIRRAVPRTPLLVVGSYWPAGEAPVSLRYIHDVLRTATAAIPCASFLDPVQERWFADGIPGLVGPDGEHPTLKGLRYVAERYAQDLRRIGYLVG